MINVDVINEGWPVAIDWDQQAESAIVAALTTAGTMLPPSAEVAIRLTTDAEVRALNRAYRGKDNPTNVLSFPMCDADVLAGLANAELPVMLGDIVLAHGVCQAEGEDKGVPLADHAAHLIVHGMLHLLGYDHVDDDDADEMEAIETAAMAALGLHRPYER